MTTSTVAPATAALTVAPDTTGDIREAVLAWLTSHRSPATREAYRRDVAAWLTWCAAQAVDPLQARRRHADLWRDQMHRDGLADATIARRLAAVSSMYAYLVDEDLADRNPAARVKRPRGTVDRAATPALDDAEAADMLAAASAPGESPRTRAAVALLLTLGLRVSELVAADVEDLGVERGHRTLTVTRKGGGRARLVVPGPVAHDVDLYLAGRSTGPLLATSTGGRVDRRAMHRLVVRLAQRAGVPAGHVGPHALRRTAATLLLDGGTPLRDVQQLLGHADPRTTQGYDRSRKVLTRQAAAVAALAAVIYPIPGPYDDAEDGDR